jgi:hypothetical protein
MPGGARAGDDGAQVGQLAAGQPGGVLQRRERDDRGAVLVIVKDRDVEALLEAALDLEATRRGDVLQVDPAEARSQPGDRVDDLVDVLRGERDRHRVDAGEVLEQRRLALHDGQRGGRADVAQTQNGRAIGDDRDEVAAPGVVLCEARVLLDREADLGDTRGVGERQIVGVLQRRGHLEGDLPTLVQREHRLVRRLHSGSRREVSGTGGRGEGLMVCGRCHRVLLCTSTRSPGGGARDLRQGVGGCCWGRPEVLVRGLPIRFQG